MYKFHKKCKYAYLIYKLSKFSTANTGNLREILRKLKLKVREKSKIF